MADMIVSTPIVKKIVQDYDFIFSSGVALPVTIDETHGDTIQINEHLIRIHIASKPSSSDPSRSLPAENITLFVQHLLSIQNREREVQELTPSQQFELNRTIKTMSPTIQ